MNEIVDGGDDYDVTYQGKRGIEELSWKEINLEKSKYVMQAFPTSFLPKTPAGKFQMVQELVQAGFINKEDAIKMLDFPDVQGTTNLMASASVQMDMVIEQMIEKNIYVAPEPFQNLEYGVPKMQGAYLQAKVDGVPEDRLEKMRRWMSEASNMGAPQEVQGMPPEGVPTGVPAPQPQAELLPNTPMQ
jgi:hypothetical protein